jgi:hypothetical protein
MAWLYGMFCFTSLTEWVLGEFFKRTSQRRDMREMSARPLLFLSFILRCRSSLIVVICLDQYRLRRWAAFASTSVSVFWLPGCSVFSRGLIAPAGPIAVAERHELLVISAILVVSVSR